MTSIRFVYLRTVKKVENRVANKWVRGTGKDAVFKEESTGWYATFVEDPTAIYLGMTETGLVAGDRMRFTAEKVG
jgi:hypothetical protein